MSTVHELPVDELAQLVFDVVAGYGTKYNGDDDSESATVRLMVLRESSGVPMGWPGNKGLPSPQFGYDFHDLKFVAEAAIRRASGTMFGWVDAEKNEIIHILIWHGYVPKTYLPSDAAVAALGAARPDGDEIAAPSWLLAAPPLQRLLAAGDPRLTNSSRLEIAESLAASFDSGVTADTAITAASLALVGSFADPFIPSVVKVDCSLAERLTTLAKLIAAKIRDESGPPLLQLPPVIV